MSEDFDSDEWHLAGSLSRGLGRSWLVTDHGLDDRWGQGPWHQAASTYQTGMAWLRERLNNEAGKPVPTRVDRRSTSLFFVYVNRRHIEEAT